MKNMENKNNTATVAGIYACGENVRLVMQANSTKQEGRDSSTEPYDK